MEVLRADIGIFDLGPLADTIDPYLSFKDLYWLRKIPRQMVLRHPMLRRCESGICQ